MNYGGKCRDLHGHSYTVVVEILSREIDKRGLAVDFGEVKRVLQGWLDANWDHNAILCVDDSLCKFLTDSPDFRTPYPLPFNPTAEVMAAHLLKKFEEIIFLVPSFENASVKSVEVFETTTSSCKVQI
jgi:6-pyruvoyltetrahydropterin/6-carboxytetrahydropterin synthase